MQMIDYGKVDTGPQTPTPLGATLARQEVMQSRKSQGLGNLPRIPGVPSVAQLATAAVRSVTFKSTITPDYTYDPNAPSRPGGMGDWVMKVLKPSMVIETPGGAMVYAPYGEAQTSLFPILALGVVAAAGFGGYLLYRGMTK